MKRQKKIFKKHFFLILGGVFLIIFVLEFLPNFLASKYNSLDKVLEAEGYGPQKSRVSHVETPKSVRAIYMTSWIAGTPHLREERILKLLDETELNSVVIDIKDDTGRVSFQTDDPLINELGSSEVRIEDIRELIEKLHKKEVYVIGRIAVFQDPFMTAKRPDLAVKRQSDINATWKDRKGLSWVDPGAREHWDYIVRLAHASYRLGFDEINFDYIRFPSDGDMTDIYYPWSGSRLSTLPSSSAKAHVIRDFFAYLHTNMYKPDPVTGDKFEGKISADLFGMTTTALDDMRIGQILDFAWEYFDYIAPMVYPSHFPRGYFGIEDVNAVPGTIIKISMGEAVKRAVATTTSFLIPGENAVSTSTPNLFTKKSYNPNKLRPWLQDNDYPVHYTAEMVRAQIDATYSVGLNSWMLWDAANTYTVSALRSE